MMKKKKKMLTALLKKMETDLYQSMFDIHYILEHEKSLFSNEELAELVKVVKITLTNGSLNKPLKEWQEKNSAYFSGNSKIDPVYYDKFYHSDFTLNDMVELCDRIVSDEMYGNFIVRNITVCAAEDIKIADIKQITDICVKIVNNLIK